MTLAAARGNDDVGAPPAVAQTNVGHAAPGYRCQQQKQKQKQKQQKQKQQKQKQQRHRRLLVLKDHKQHHQMHLNAIVRYAMHGCPTRRLRS